MDALRAIGANTAVTGLGFPTPTLVFRSGSGKLLGTVPLGGALADGTVTHTIKRSDLYGALQDEASGRGVEVTYGKALTAADVLPGGGVRATFSDGPGTFEMTFGKRAFFAYTVNDAGEVWWFANPPRRLEPTTAELAAITDAVASRATRAVREGRRTGPGDHRCDTRVRSARGRRTTYRGSRPGATRP